MMLEAEEFILKGPDGKIRARLGLNPDGGVFFILLDATGTPRSELSVSSAGTSFLVQAAADRKARIVSRVESDGTSGVFLFDAAGKAIWSTSEAR